MVGRPVTLLAPPDRVVEMTTLMRQMRQGEHLAEYETERKHKDGHRVPVSVTVAPIHDEQGGLIGSAVVARDISRRKAAEAALRESDAQFHSLVEQAPIGACIVDAQGRYEVVNKAFAMMVGYDREELAGQHFGILFSPAEQARIGAVYVERARSGATIQQEHEIVAKGGEHLTVLVSSIQIAPDAEQQARRAIFVTDITARKRSERLLAHAAYHDTLTGLPNRLLFADRLELALHTAHRDAASMAILVLDLDGFKAVNDMLGHATGDKLLQVVAERLQSTVRESDTVARRGGDEFAILLPRAEAAGAERVASQISGILAEPILLIGGMVSVGASIGIAIYPGHGKTDEALLQCADRAMYAAKTSGGGYRVYGENQAPS